MRGAVVQVLLWAWVVVDRGSGSVVMPEITDRGFIDECVREHNKARSSVQPPASDMLYMSWDEGLATTAGAWAKRCVYEHNVHLQDAFGMHPAFEYVGENIWAGHPPSLFSVRRAVERWVNETYDYRYQDNSCRRECGHYTQVVWASSHKVGCAIQLCPGGVRKFSQPSAFFVCNYAPGGNVNSYKPYKEGTACSGCSGTCQDRLCRSPERDTERRYNWAPAWAASPSGRANYVSILIVRPVALFFTFIAAYAVHYKYPNVFCYE